MTKEEFVRYLSEIKDTVDYVSEINGVISKYNGEGYLFPPDCSYLCTRLLGELLNDSAGEIEYFCWELDFGRLWQPGTITDQNGNDVIMAKAEDLWDFLNTRKK